MENKKRYSKLQSGLKGALQGASLGFEDELAGLVGSGLDKSQELLNKLGLADKSPSQVDKELGLENDMYKEFRDAARQQNLEAEAENPLSYMGGQLTGSALPMIAGGAIASGSNLAKLNALENLAQGIGSSNSSNVADLGLEALENAALNKVGSGALKMLPKNIKNKTAEALENAKIGKFGKEPVVRGGLPNKIIYPKGQPIYGQGEFQASGGKYLPTQVIDDIKPKNFGNVSIEDQESQIKKRFTEKLLDSKVKARLNPEKLEESQKEIEDLINKIKPLYKNK